MEPNVALRRARQERGWSQADVATKLETSAKNISRWELGTTRPSPYFRAKLCQLFNTDIQTLGLLDKAPSLSIQHEDISSLPEHIPQSPIIDPALHAISFASEHLVGRDALVQTVIATLCSGHTCALHGLPGVGKTTLAQVVAHHETIRAHFPDGVLWVGLGPSPNMMSAFIRWATLLSVSEDALQTAQTVEAVQTLVRHALHTRRMLLIIDDAWTSDVAYAFLLESSTCVHLLTTRFPQVALLVTDETPLLVPELDEPETMHLLTSLVPTLSAGDSTQLQKLFRMTGGLPLAVMLIGKYLRLHAYSGQPRRLQSALTTLTDAHTRLQLALPSSTIHGIGEMPPSLHTIIALSDEYLSSQAQEALRALSVFPAKPERFSEAAALAVCQQDATVLDQLSDAGLLESAEAGWYRLHQTIADYAQLHRQGLAPFHRLVQYACDVCRTQKTNITMLDQEYTTLLTALESAVQNDLFEARLLLVEGLCRIWRVRRRYTVAEQHLQSALERAQITHDRRGIIRMLYEQASIARSRGAYAQVEAALQRALTLAREDVDTDLLQLVLISLGDVAFHIHGDLGKANDYWQEAFVLLGKHNTREQRLRVLSNLGMVAGMREEREQAEQYFLEVLSGVKDIQYPELEGMTLLNLGYLYVNVQGKHAKAEDYYKQALEVALHYSFEEKGCLARVVLGELARRRGDVETAEQLLRDAVSVARTLEDPVTLSQTLDGFALIKIEQGKLIEAEQYVQEALALVTNMPYALSAIRGTWGLLLLQQQRLEEAAHQYEIALETLPRGQESMFAEPLYGLARVRFAQGDMSAARQLGEQSLSIMEATHYWRTDEVRQWLKQQITQYAPQASEVTHHPPHQSPPTTQLSPGQRKVVSTTRETSLSEKVTCPSCAQSQGFVKHSHNRSGSQRYQCTACRKVFTPFPRPTGKGEQNKILARQLAAAGMSQRAIGRRLGVYHTTVKAWLMRTITSQ